MRRSRPTAGAVGPILGYLIAGSFIVETIFGIPGIGRYYVTAVQRARLLGRDGDNGDALGDHRPRESRRRHPLRLPRPENPRRPDLSPIQAQILNLLEQLQAEFSLTYHRTEVPPLRKVSDGHLASRHWAEEIEAGQIQPQEREAVFEPGPQEAVAEPPPV